MARFADTERCITLARDYADLIRSGGITIRELASETNITKHKACIVFDQVREGRSGANADPEEESVMREIEGIAAQRRDLVAKDTLERALAGAPRVNGLPVGMDSPDLAEIVGRLSGKQENAEAVVERALAHFKKKSDERTLRKHQRVVFTGGPIGIVFGGDEHFGGTTDVARIFEEARIVNETPGLYHARMGDFVNQFILGRMRSIRDHSIFSIKDEWVMTQVLLDLIAPKLIAVVGGNHDAWADKASGMDRLSDILPDGILYDPNEIEFAVHVGDARRVIKMRHKWRYSSIFNPTHGIEVAAQRSKATWDIAVGAHTHIAALVRPFWAQGKRRLAVLTNTFKKIDDYAEEEGFPESDDSSTCSIVIIEENGEMFGAPSLQWAAQYMKMRYKAAA